MRYNRNPLPQLRNGAGRGGCQAKLKGKQITYIDPRGSAINYSNF
jgi:hypothetical protein